jgi:hypothetical protein
VGIVKMEVCVMIDRPVEEVWKFMTDWSNHWDPESMEMKQTSDGPVRVGTSVRIIHPKYPRILNFLITEYEPNRKFTFEVASGPIRGSRFVYTMENIEGKTRLTEAADYNFPGFYKLFQPIAGRPAKLRREGEARISSAKSALEPEMPS